MKLLKWISFSMVLGLVVSCYPEKDRTINDYDIIGTRYADDVVFKDNYQTFYLYDSVIIVYDSSKTKPDYPLNEANAILSTMRTNLLNYGWTELTRNQILAGDTPDVYIESSTWNSTVSGAIYYPGYGYPGYGYPGYGYGYPWYGGGVSYYSYTTGTIVMTMQDIKNHDFNDDPAKVIWNGALNGILNSSSNTISRIEYSINQAFNQSQYLNLTK